ncbi:unnamed protein product [Clonostachys rosea f. rosea IK726]|uniref:Peptidase S9 prolyl oligopeptidase catalytic domain-containing protein n=2 Tax=Bionectria ochroleuca TaxID=29856 RepID=A0A0B7K1Y1_BIOOC|nr:unnamed protein product [Clonostachys rosea f. rosea IK726]
MKLSPVAGIVAASAFLGVSRAQEQETDPVLLLSSDSAFHAEMLGGMGYAIGGGADISPILAAAKDVIPGDFERFGDVFFKLAEETKSQALDPDNAYDPVNVRDTWFSTANYFRRADMFLHGNWSNPALETYWEEQLNAFNQGIAALPVPGERIQIPADNFTVEAIWYSASPDNSTKRPTLIIGNGFDAAQEDIYHTLAAHALARGWNALTYEGPGQPTVRRSQNLGFIHQWERVVTPAVDYLLENKSSEIDTERLVLFGNSLGGYLAARAAAFEPRIKAVMLNGGIYDLHEGYTAQLTTDLAELYHSGQKDLFDEAALSILDDRNVSSQLRWGIEYGLWAFNVKSPYDFLQLTQQYTVKDILSLIKVPVWVADFEFEGIFTGQPQRVKDALGDLGTLHTFNGSAGYHCQPGAYMEMNRAVFAWLHKTLG